MSTKTERRHGEKHERRKEKESKTATTPAMRQYHDIKLKAPDAILFFRMGDFYEMFYDDALAAARTLELTLTSRQKDPNGSAIPMCGVPYHAADTYIARLIRKGFKVAVCDQLEDAKQAKGIVRRDIVRVVTPATYLHDGYLEANEPSYLMALFSGKESVGVALVDLSTGDFSALELAGEERFLGVEQLVATYRPREILKPEGVSLREPEQRAAGEVLGSPATTGRAANDRASEAAFGPGGPLITDRESWRFDYERSRSRLLSQFGAVSLEGFGLEDRVLSVSAAGAALEYLEETQRGKIAHIVSIRFLEEADHLILDPVTQKNLELTRSISEGSRQGSLLAILDRTGTSMGARLLKSWLLRPLVDRGRIASRLDAVEELAFDTVLRGKTGEALRSVQDLERLLSRVTLGSASPRDFVAIASSLTKVPFLRGLFSGARAELLRNVLEKMDSLEDVRDDIEHTLVSEPPATLKEGGAIRGGVSEELDELRRLRTHGKETLVSIELRERERTGISNLRVRFNKVFGYYIEVTKSKLDSVPGDYVRKQTLVGSERFITQELKEYEDKILHAEERILTLENELFQSLASRVRAEAGRIQSTAEALSTIDVLTALAEVATTSNYTKPLLHDGYELELEEARHPVIEALSSEPFVPNDVRLDEDRQLMILTGPNMGGKSTFLRQTALSVLLAQMGSFVPAKSAKLPIVDRIFTRVGASDNLFRGRSTFMVEMQETAHILHHATRKSLVLLDEIGRGTATFDGLSIAWSVAEHLASSPRLKSKTIFATHYHELTDLASEVPGVVNCHVSAREWQDDIVFLRKVIDGGSDRSYGIQVARLAGLPPEVIRRAREILVQLEKSEFDAEGNPRVTGPTDLPGAGAQSRPQRQLSLFADAEARAVAEIRRLDPDSVSPIEALTLLAELKKSLE